MTVEYIQSNAPNPDDPTDALVARLAGTGFPGGIGEWPGKSPGGPYWCLYPDPGWATHPRYHAATGRVEWVFRVVYVGGTVQGALAAAAAGRRRLVDWRPDFERSTSPIAEFGYPGPALTDGPSGDRRVSVTVTYHYYTHRSPHAA